MFDQVNLTVILLAALVAGASPGPATLAIANTSMSSGRVKGLALAAGITTGSWFWSISAALGLGAIMAAHAWAFEVVRYLGAAYLLFLAFKSARSAVSKNQTQSKFGLKELTIRSAYLHGLGLHLTNPKAILFFGALFSVGVPPGTSTITLFSVIAAVGLQSFVMFHAYALIFSSASMVKSYARMRRWFEGVFAIFFGLAGIKMLTAKLG